MVELFPLAFAVIMVAGSVMFSVWVVAEMVKTGRERKRGALSTDNPASSQALPTSTTEVPPTMTTEEKHHSLPFLADWNSKFKHSMPTTDEEEDKKSTILSWSEISCTYPAKKKLEGNPIVTLSNASGEIRAKELTAIMGSSGSGKSTLLDILSGRKTFGKITGKVSILGQDLKAQLTTESSILRAVAAYVPQQDAFFPMQTAEEAVLFSANLKLGKDPLGDDVRKYHVQSILREVGLSSDVCSRPIGGQLAGGIVIRGLSGGERKRLSLACAIALKPRLFFLDEITSGLDSENALAITKLLKSICVSNNVAAVMVIHQPSGALFKQFDRLALLSKKGRMIFSDEVSNIPRLYERIFLRSMPEWYDLPSDLVQSATKLSEDTVISVSNHASLSRDPTSCTVGDQVKNLTQPSTLWKFRVVFTRNLVNHYIRNLTNLACRLAIYGACSLLDGLLFWQVGDVKVVEQRPTLVIGEVNGVIGAFTFILMVSYLLPFAMISIFFHDKKFFLTEKALGLYSPWLYCISQILLETWVLVLASTFEACIIVPMCGLWNPTASRWESFFTTLSTLLVSGLTGSSLILLQSMAVPSQDLAFLSGASIVTVSLGLSGGFVPFPKIEKFISWLQWLSPCKYSLQGLAQAYFSGTAIEPFVMANYEFDRPATISANIGVLLCMFTAMSVGTMVALSRQRETR